MRQLDDYIDVRHQLPRFERRICPDHGAEAWFKHKDAKRWRTDQWNCQECGSYFEHTLEYPCPRCDIRMVYDSGSFHCKNPVCQEGALDVDSNNLLSRLSSDSYPEHAHKPGVLGGTCPLCGENYAVNGGPDGELECDECGDFYAGQYSDEWYCYAIWMRDPEKIRVNPP